MYVNEVTIPRASAPTAANSNVRFETRIDPASFRMWASMVATDVFASQQMPKLRASAVIVPGASVEEIMANIRFPLADEFYFPGLGNSVNFISPGGIEGIAGRLAYSATNNIFSLIWDEAVTVDLPEKLAQAVCETSTPTWPHTFVVPKYASMVEYKQYAPANHFHMTWGLTPARLEYWMDLANVLSATPWQARPKFIEGVDRPMPLLYIINGGEDATKLKLAQRFS